MKSNSRFCVLFLTACLLINALTINIINAQPVDSVQAKLVAKNYFADRLSQSRLCSIKGISYQNLEMSLVYERNENISNPNDLKKGSQSLSLYYIFNIMDKVNPKDKDGFIIVSADQRVPAVLGYSFTGEFSENEQAPAFKDWMDYYKEQIIYIIQNNLIPDPEINDEWKKYSGTIELKGSEQITEVGPLLTTKWSQRSHYNDLCPADADISCGGSLNYHVPAGCVAVAMAQIMRYHRYPAANNPIPGYDDPLSIYNFPTSPLNGTSISYGSIPAVGETTYDWGNMPASVDKAASPLPVQIDAVSKLIYHCGVAVQMNYGPPNNGSGAGSPFNSILENAFRYYFKYSQSIQKINRSNNDSLQWESTLKNELDNYRPVYYSGYKNNEYDEGHAFVCDGYRDIRPYFHFNFGFGGGGGDGYYYIDYLKPSASHDLRYMQWAIIGISHDQASAITDTYGNHYYKVYPNPFTDQIYFDLQLKTDSKVHLEIYNIYGSKIATVYNDVVVAYDFYRFEYVPENLGAGILLYRLIVDGQLMYTGNLIHY